MSSNLKPVPFVKASTGPQARTSKIAPTPSGSKIRSSKVSVPGLNTGVKVTRGDGC